MTIPAFCCLHCFGGSPRRIRLSLWHRRKGTWFATWDQFGDRKCLFSPPVFAWLASLLLGVARPSEVGCRSRSTPRLQLSKYRPFSWFYFVIWLNWDNRRYLEKPPRLSSETPTLLRFHWTTDTVRRDKCRSLSCWSGRVNGRGSVRQCPTKISKACSHCCEGGRWKIAWRQTLALLYQWLE